MCIRDSLQHFLEQTPKKDVLLIIRDWNAKVGSQKIKGTTGKFVKRANWSSQTLFSNNTRDDSTHGHHHMGNTEIRLIIFSAAKDGEAL